MEKQPRTQLPAGRIPTLRLEPMPRDTNQHGDIFGGWVMSQVDLAAKPPCATPSRRKS